MPTPPLEDQIARGEDRRQMANVAEVLRVQLQSLHADVKGMEDVLKELTSAITKLAVMEERQANAHQAIERAFSVLVKLEERVGEIELAMRDSTRTSIWVDRGIWAAAAAAAVYIAKKTGLMQ